MTTGSGKELVGFVSNRGHHADVGGMTPGSLPLSTELYQEGLILPPIKLARAGRLNQEVVQLICRNSRTPEERRGDLAAQIASIRVGEKRLQEVGRTIRSGRHFRAHGGAAELLGTSDPASHQQDS